MSRPPLLEKLVVVLLPVLTVAYAWARLEAPPRVPAVLAVVLAGVAAGLVAGRARTAVSLAGIMAILSVAFRVSPLDALPFTDGTWFGTVKADMVEGLRGFDAVALPFDTGVRPEMHGLVLLACGLFALAIAQAASAGSTRRVVLVTLLGGGWGATTSERLDTAALGALLLAATLWPVALRSVRRPAATARRTNAAVAALVLVAAGAGSAVALGVAPGEAAVDWRGWSIIDAARGKVGVQYVWDSNYDGVKFPEKPTTVLRIRSTERALYWRASTLDLFVQDRWLENIVPLAIGDPNQAVPSDPLRVPRAREQAGWVEQQVEVVALDDEHLVAASEPMWIEGRSLPQVQFGSGGVIQARDRIPRGSTYRVWSYAPSPRADALERSLPRYPPAASHYLRIDRATTPIFGAPGRSQAIDDLFTDLRYQPMWAYEPVWQQAQKIAGGAGSPYAAVLAVERWLRADGGFVYDQQPALSTTAPPLVDFVTRTRAGYCQHYAGAMTLMLRFLGIPSRVAVGFTAGRLRQGVWEVADQNAHAWVEAWFDGYGWLPFDPTPGRGRFAAAYSFASDSADAIRALGGDRLPGPDDPLFSPSAPVDTRAAAGQGSSLPWPALGIAGCLLALIALGLVKRGLRLRRYHVADPRRRAAAALHELRDILRDQGVHVPVTSGVRCTRQLAERHLGVAARGLAEAVGAGCYGPPAQADAAATRAAEEMRRYRRLLREELGPWQRLRGYLSPASLLTRARRP